MIAIQRKPEIIFSTTQNLARRATLEKLALGQIENGLPLTPRMIDSIMWYPDVLARVLESPKCPRGLISRVYGKPYVMLDLVLHDYRCFAATYESHLYSRPEMVEYLLMVHPHLLAHGITPQQSRDNLIDMLRIDPVRWLQYQTGELREHSMAAIIEEVEARRTENAYWAYAFFVLSPDGPYYEEVIDRLSSDEYCVLLAMKTIARHAAKFPEGLMTHLSKRICSPRWAYHLLKSGIPSLNGNHLQALITAHPGWTVEYLGNNPDGITLEKMITESMKVASSHELYPEMLEWVQTLRPDHAVESGATAASSY